MLDTKSMLSEIDKEIARLTKLRAAILEASGDTGQSPMKSRLSPQGSKVIALAARLKALRRKGTKDEIRKLEAELQAAKEAARAAKKG